MEKVSKTHFLRCDYRKVSLEITIEALSNSIDLLKMKMKRFPWYDGGFFIEESEFIYGLAFISFQNYINISIKDISGTLEPLIKTEYYKLDKNISETGNSKIELIIALANFAKHKEEGKLHFGTKLILDKFNLNYYDELDPLNSAMFQGLSILDENWDLIKIKDLVLDWREFIWASNEV